MIFNMNEFSLTVLTDSFTCFKYKQVKNDWKNLPEQYDKIHLLYIQDAVNKNKSYYIMACCFSSKFLGI